MRAVIDATAFGSGRGGDETFLSGVVEGLVSAHGPGDEFRLITRLDAALPEPVVRDPAFRAQPVAASKGIRWYAASLPRLLRAHAESADVVMTITHAPITSPIPVALTIGDLSFVHQPETYPRATRLRLNTLVSRQVRTSRVVLVPSQFSRDDVVTTYGVDPEKVFVVPNRVLPVVPLTGPERDAARAELDAAGVRDPFIVYVGNLHPRKNVPALIRSFGRARVAHPELAGVQLVVAGARWWGGDEEGRAAEQVGGVAITGRVSEPARRLLLERALACAYVSTYEGFGLPPLEAMAAGVPVVASNSTAVREVCEGAAELVDPLDEESIADGLARVCTDESLRERLREAGSRRAAYYDASVTGRAALTALRYAAGSDAYAPDGVGTVAGLAAG